MEWFPIRFVLGGIEMRFEVAHEPTNEDETAQMIDLFGSLSSPWFMCSIHNRFHSYEGYASGTCQ